MSGELTLALLHGAAHDASVWDGVRAASRTCSVAVDLPGRRSRPADLGDGSAASWTRSVVDDLAATGDGPLVLVGHSAAGTILPRVAAALGPRVVHLVFVAGLIAPDGEMVADHLDPDRTADMVAAGSSLRSRWRGHTFVPEGAEAPDGLHPLRDHKVLLRLDSMVAMTEPVSWSGVADDLPRTWVRCLADRIQPRAFQARLAANAGATDDVVDIDSGHTPASARPQQLATILDGIVERHA